MFTDTHCHIFKEYYDDIDNIIDSFEGVKYIINNACDLKTSMEVLEYSNKYKNVYCALGLHPTENLNDINEVLEFIEKNKTNKKLLAIGEIGLDYHYGKELKDKQVEVFEKQLELASKLSLPVIIHSRDATKDTLDILKKFKLKGIIHCFNGSLEIAKEYIKLGYKIGINGIITFKNCKLINIINDIGLDNIVFETDSPYLSPEPIRGSKNNPSNIKYIIEFLSKNLNIDEEKLTEIVNKNVKELFDII